MAERVRFHLDEHVTPKIAEGLRRRGIDVTTTVEAGMRTRDDNRQWVFVAAERRVIVTYDDDFLVLASRDPSHPGIAFCPSPKRTIGQIVLRLVRIWETFTPEQMIGRVEYL